MLNTDKNLPEFEIVKDKSNKGNIEISIDKSYVQTALMTLAKDLGKPAVKQIMTKYKATKVSNIKKINIQFY